MNYSDARSSIRSGDLLGFSHGSWRSWDDIKASLTRIFTRSEYSHVGVAWVVAGRVFVLEAVKPKVRIFPLSQSGDFYLVNLNAPWSLDTEEFSLARVGYDYSEIDAVKGFLNRLESGKVSQCAAYVLEVLKKDGIDLGQRATPDAVIRKALSFKDSKLIFIKAVK